MTRIFLIRHAEAEGNLYRIAQGQSNGLITDRGYRQIEVLRRRFENEHIDAVYSSDLFRARTTAKAISEPKNLPLNLDPAFRVPPVAGTEHGVRRADVLLQPQTGSVRRGGE